MDSDDWIEKDYLKILWEAAQKYRADIAICELSSNEDNISEEEKCMKDTISILDSREALTALYVNKFIRDHFCGKLFKKEIFGDIRFPKNKCFEDIFVTSVPGQNPAAGSQRPAPAGPLCRRDW